MHCAVSWGARIALVAAMLLSAVPVSGQAPPDAKSYVRTQIEAVRGGLVYGMVVHPKTHAVYLASETMRGGFWGAAHDPNNGTWMSNDDGRSWRRIGPGGRNVKVSADDPNIIYANDRYGLYKTTDGGTSWTTILPPEHALGYRGLDICATNHNVVYAGGPGALHVSRDGGASWTHVDLPKNVQGIPARIQVIQVHPTNPDTAFFAFYEGGHSGVWKTVNGGKTFTQLTAANARGMAICAGNPDTIYCSTAVSHNGGATWTPTQRLGLPAWCITVHPTRPNVAFYSRPGAPVYCTTDGGKLFHTIQGVLANYDGTEVEGMTIDAARDILWAGGDMIWRGERASSGRVRLTRTDRGFHDISLSHIASTSTGVWACSDAQGMHYTTDGRRWTTTAMGMHGTDALHRVTPSPSDPKTIYAGHETRLFKSVDGGNTWYNIHNGWYPFCLVDAKDPNVVYFSSRSGTEDMFCSDDGGATFHALGPGRFVAVHPAQSGTVYAERADGLYLSTDKGATLTKISDQTHLGDVLISRMNPQVLYSARYTIDRKRPVDSALFRSDDGGRTWQPLPIEIHGLVRIAEIGDDTLWLSSQSTGLTRSVDGGRTWQPVWEAFGDIAADPWDRHSLYMITRGGIWWLHPATVQREEIVDVPTSPAPAPTTHDVNAPLLIERSNTTYRFARDIRLTGNSQSLALLTRGLRNVILDGQGHTITLTGAAAIFGDDAENITIRNFRFVAEREKGPGTVLSLSHSRNVRIEHCIFAVPGAISIHTDGIFTDNVVIDHCTFPPASRTAAIIGTGRHTIRHCTMTTPSGTAVVLTLAAGSVLENNDFGNAGVVRIER